MKQEHKELFDAYAIFESGGKQYQAIIGKTIALEKLDAAIGSTVTVKEVLFRKNGENAYEVGKPYVKGASISLNVVKHIHGPKLVVFKFGRRKKIRTKKGHRQPLTVVRVEKI
jgi:large subunit ribosomal protein L21